MVNVYGIKNCDTMKKAFTWLQSHAVDYTFVDYKKAGVVEIHIDDWVKRAGWERLLNKRGLMWKKLDDATRSDIDEVKAIRIMTQYPSIIKRPILDDSHELIIGFDPDVYAERFNKG